MRSRSSGGFSMICEKRTTVTVSSIVDLAAVDLLEEVDHLVVAAELRVVVLDVAGRQVLDPLDLDLVDHRVEDLLARRVLVADRDQHASFLRYLCDLSPRRIVAVLRPRFSWSANIVE